MGAEGRCSSQGSVIGGAIFTGTAAIPRGGLLILLLAVSMACPNTASVPIRALLVSGFGMYKSGLH